jgi:hypothetical protein
MRSGVALLLSMCVTAATVSASVGRPPDVASRAKSASKIVVATVTDVEPGRFDVSQYGDRVIVTRAWLRVDEMLKGNHEPLIALDIEGGSVGDLTLRVSDMPTLKKGERGVFFLDNPRRDAHEPNGRGAGILKLDLAGRVLNSNLTLADVRANVRAALQ